MFMLFIGRVVVVLNGFMLIYVRVMVSVSLRLKWWVLVIIIIIFGFIFRVMG